MEKSTSDPQISALKAKFNLKETFIKLHRLPKSVSKETTVTASSLIDKSHSHEQKRNEVKKQKNGQHSHHHHPEANGFQAIIADEVPKQLIAQGRVPFLQARIFPPARNQRNDRWDSSFFLHMNRYKPEESCFFTPPPEAPPVPPPQQPTHPPPPPPVKLPSFPVPPKNKAQSRPPPQPQSPPISFKRTVNKQKSKLVSLQLLNNRKMWDNAGAGVGHWKCDYCPKTFNHKHNMTTHLLMHTGVKPFVCRLCSAQFRQKCHMIRHIAGYHPYQARSTLSAGNATGSCAFCGETFNTPALLQTHIRKGHKDKVAPVH